MHALLHCKDSPNALISFSFLAHGKQSALCGSTHCLPVYSTTRVGDINKASLTLLTMPIIKCGESSLMLNFPKPTRI